MDKVLIAQVAHEVNRAYCASIGDASVPAWADAAKAHRDSVLAVVEMHLANPNTTPEAAHASWLETKTAEGWKFGEKKNASKKLHPCMLPYAELPAEQKVKDHLFRGVVHVLVALPEPEPIVREVKVEVPVEVPVEVLVEVPTKAIIPAGYVAVKYIGVRRDWEDRHYRSGLSFVADQTRAVPPAVARNLLRHTDLFAAGDLANVLGAKVADDTQAQLEQAGKDEAQARELQQHRQDVYDRVVLMDVAGLKEFAMVNYRQTLNEAKDVAALRAEVIGMVDQFGAP